VGLAIIPLNYILLITCFGLIGFSLPAMAYMSLYLNEIGNAEFRNVASPAISLGNGFGSLALIGIGYKYRSWRLQTAIVGITNTIGLFSFILVSETPLFLIS
jgi:hypothetical protein